MKKIKYPITIIVYSILFAILIVRVCNAKPMTKTEVDKLNQIIQK